MKDQYTVVAPLYSSSNRNVAEIKMFEATDPSHAYLPKSHLPSIPCWIQIGIYFLRCSSCKGTEQNSISSILSQCAFSAYLCVHTKYFSLEFLEHSLWPTGVHRGKAYQLCFTWKFMLRRAMIGWRLSCYPELHQCCGKGPVKLQLLCWSSNDGRYSFWNLCNTVRAR